MDEPSLGLTAKASPEFTELNDLVSKKVKSFIIFVEMLNLQE
jgi:hypothetical protein